MSREHRTLEQAFWDLWHKLTGKYVTWISSLVSTQSTNISDRERQRQIPPPWDENWKLDDKFFKDLADWDSKHQDSTFLGVVEKIKDAIITCKPVIGLIPDTPFPARTLVQALSYFLQLGVVGFTHFCCCSFSSEINAIRQ